MKTFGLSLFSGVGGSDAVDDAVNSVDLSGFPRVDIKTSPTPNYRYVVIVPDIIDLNALRETLSKYDLSLDREIT